MGLIQNAHHTFKIFFCDIMTKKKNNKKKTSDYHELSVFCPAGKRMWRYMGTVLDPGFPMQNKVLGLPRRLDCAFYYTPLGHMVLFKGSRYFVLNLKTLRQEPYYPRRLTDWTGLPQGTNGALTRPDGRLYLFKNQRFWRFDPVKVRITREGQWVKDLSWTGCSNIPRSNNILWPRGGAAKLKVQFTHIKEGSCTFLNKNSYVATGSWWWQRSISIHSIYTTERY